MTLQSVGLFLLVCFFSTAGAQTAQDSPQQNISLIWVDGMYPEICFLPPPEKSVQNSEYKIVISTTPEGCQDHKVKITSEEYCTSEKTIMHGGRVKFFLNTSCKKKGDKSAVISYINPVLVKSWECVIRSSNLTHCSWKPTPDAPPDLSFFYILRCTNCNGKDRSPIQECPSYTYTDKIRTGCNLPMKSDQSIRILFNGTVDNKPVRNTYKNITLNVKLDALIWTVTKIEKKLNISWIPPDVLRPSQWTFIINYTRCGKPLVQEVPSGKTYLIIEHEPSCQYRISIRAEASIDRGGTEWSQEEIIYADSNLSLFAAITIPLVLAIVVVLMLVFCRQNKEIIFPKVPVPRDLLSDISENNNKITVGNLYIPGKEEEECKISLVIDPQINNLDT